MPIRGVITLPGDKSISHRALLIGALIKGENYIQNLSTAKDVQSSRDCLKQLGVKIYNEKDIIVIEGSEFTKPINPLDCENSGTTMRLLAGILGGLNINSKIIGDKSLSKRPMDRVVNPLNDMGINIQSNNGFPPIIIEKSQNIYDLKYDAKISSAQVKSALLLAGFCSNNKIIINEKYKSRDHT